MGVEFGLTVQQTTRSIALDAEASLRDRQITSFFDNPWVRASTLGTPQFPSRLFGKGRERS